MKLKLSIIIVSYNTCDYTLACLKSVLSETKKYEYEILFIDNNSSDATVSEVEKLDIKNIKIIKSDINHGFAKANNIAAKYATGEYILLLNPDTIVLNSAIDNLIDFSTRYPDSRIWGGKTLFSDRSLNKASCWSKQTLWSLLSQAMGLSSVFKNSSIFNPEGIGGWDRVGIRIVDIVSGCFFLIKNKDWNNLDGFNEKFFMYGEEADLCLRAQKKGFSPIVSSDATIIHYGGVSETVKSDKLVRLLKAKMCLIKEHFPNTQKPIATRLLALWPFSRYLAHTILSFLGRNKSMPAKEQWHEVWMRRDEWFLY